MEYKLKVKRKSLFNELVETDVELKINAYEALILSSLLVSHRGEVGSLMKNTLLEYGVNQGLAHSVSLGAPVEANKMHSQLTSLESEINREILGGRK